MKRALVFLAVVGLVLAISGTVSVFAQTTYDLYAVANSVYPNASNFHVRYMDLDGDKKCSLNEIMSFSGVTWNGTTYSQVLGVPCNNPLSPRTDGPCSDDASYGWYFNRPSNDPTTAYIKPYVWTYSQMPVATVGVPGKTVVMDYAGDLQLKNCDPYNSEMPCSLPPGAPLGLHAYFDIKSAQITQVVGGEQVDLSIQLYEPIPSQPPYSYISYVWQFAGGCIGGEPGAKDAIIVLWNYPIPQEWTAVWGVIESCDPRVIEVDYAHPLPLTFTPDGLRVRVPLADLLTAADETGTLMWHAAVRRVPFIYITPLGTQFTHTTAVDYAPDVFEFNLTPPPPVVQPEDFATWEPR